MVVSFDTLRDEIVVVTFPAEIDIPPTVKLF